MPREFNTHSSYDPMLAGRMEARPRSGFHHRLASRGRSKAGFPVADNLRTIAGAGAIISGKSPPESLGVRATSDSVLKVNLEQPTADLPQILANSAAFPVYSDTTARSHLPRDGSPTVHMYSPNGRREPV